ncbi:MAG: polyprenyl diphosphate synthase [Candidatus Nealsonbacteria bacterium]
MDKISIHLGIIMDGNRRWAEKHGLPAIRGHEAGLEALKKIVKHCQKRDIEVLTVFAFSTENWQRSEEEVGFLMNLCQKAINNDFKKLAEDGIKIRVIGEKHMLPRKLADSIIEIEKSTKNNSGMILNIALSYGGRAEIVSAVNKIQSKEITEADITKNLQAPDVDFLIRTGKEYRISNFLLWQSAYAELYFSSKYWPDFTEEDLDMALNNFASRNSRHGK